MAPRELLVPATPEEVVYRAALALRRLGARVIRYDAGAGTLEARAGRRLLPQVVRVRARQEKEGATRVVVETDRTDWRALVRQLAAELAAADWR
jgi:hypothetical protein